MILEQISSPADVKRLERGELPVLCAELRQFLIESVARTGGHLGMTLFYDALPRPARRACQWIGIAVCVIFFGALAYAGALEVLDEISLDVTSESLGIPVWWYTIATPLFSLLVIFRMLQRSLGDLRADPREGRC